MFLTINHALSLPRRRIFAFAVGNARVDIRVTLGETRRFFLVVFSLPQEQRQKQDKENDKRNEENGDKFFHYFLRSKLAKLFARTKAWLMIGDVLMNHQSVAFFVDAL